MVDTDTAEDAAAAHLVPTATPTTDRPTSTARTIDRAATAIPTTDPPTTMVPTIAHASLTLASIAHGYMAGVAGAGAGAVGVGADGGAGSTQLGRPTPMPPADQPPKRPASTPHGPRRVMPSLGLCAACNLLRTSPTRRMTALS